ncbi:MAG: YSIRK-type signal peptide-containing protein, partial [Limosilactobacillus sp.]
MQNKQSGQEYQRFSLRKLSIGVVSVAVAAGFYFAGLTSVQADAGMSGNSQPAVGSQNNAAALNRQTVIIGTAKQAAPAGSVAAQLATEAAATPSTPGESAVGNQSSSAASTAGQASSSASAAPNSADNQAHNVTLDMYTKGEDTDHQTTIAADGHQLVGIKGSFEVTTSQLAAGNPITIGTITQVRSDPNNTRNIPVLVRTGRYAITVSQANTQSVKIGELYLSKDQLGNIVLSLQNLNRNIQLNGDKKISFDIKVALDINHAADA